ncbi:MAG: outer membrane beta-barrel protein [Rhodobacterales bacterium]|nr:outer membrane beta-barrel protein [Rhodobacterales bacterium]
MNKVLLPVIVAAFSAGALPAAAQDWSGNWGGVALGYGSGTYDQGVSSVNEVGPSVDVDGALISLQYVRNIQSENAVYGFDVAISTGPSGTTARGTLGPDWSCISGECNVDIQSLITLRGRYGVLVDPATLAYGAGGLAIGNVDGGIYNSSQQGSSTAVGYTIGAGIERMLGENRTLFGEVNYVDLGTLDFGEGGDVREVYDAEGDFVTIRVGMNFRF